MSRSRYHPSRCKACGITDKDASISARGFCRQCGAARRDANIDALEKGAGPYYDHWMMRSILSLRRRTLAWEASQAQTQGVQSDT